MTKELFFYDKKDANELHIINSQYGSPFDVYDLSSAYYLSTQLKNLDKMLTNSEKATKYKITIEAVEEADISPYALLTKSIIEEYQKNVSVEYRWDMFYIPHYTEYKTFLRDDDFKEYKHFCLVKLEKPDAEFKKSNITSKIIDSGKCVGVSVSKSRTNKDCYVIYGNVSSNYDDMGIILFKDSSSYGMLRMALSANLRFYKLRDIDYNSLSKN